MMQKLRHLFLALGLVILGDTPPGHTMTDDHLSAIVAYQTFAHHLPHGVQAHAPFEEHSNPFTILSQETSILECEAIAHQIATGLPPALIHEKRITLDVWCDKMIQVFLQFSPDYVGCLFDNPGWKALVHAQQNAAVCQTTYPGLADLDQWIIISSLVGHHGQYQKKYMHDILTSATKFMRADMTPEHKIGIVHHVAIFIMNTDAEESKATCLKRVEQQLIRWHSHEILKNLRVFLTPHHNPYKC